MSYSQQLVAERYRLTSQIGAGGMGRVWLARDEMLHRDVAVKEVTLPPELTDVERAELFQRTLREARAAGRLNHPNVVAVYDVVQAEGRPWIVMELVRSRSLYQVVKQDGPLAPKYAAEIGLFVLSALRAAHAAGVWHRDVKPGNVLLADDGRVVLTDFGLATFDGDGTVTRSGIILGSAQYISPERAREGSSGPEADMWSLGATLYAAVEGRSPFARETSMATLTALATEPPDPPKRAGPLRPVLIGLLRKNPRQRMRAEEAEKLLRRVVETNAKGSAGRKAGRIPAQRSQAATSTASAASSADENADAIAASAEQSADSGGDKANGTGAGRAGGRPGPRTVTEETYRQVVKPKGRWALVWGLVAVVAALVTPAAIVLINSRHANPNESTPVVAVSASPSLLTAAMRVQACLDQPPANETVLPEPSAEETAKYGLQPNWVRYSGTGYVIDVPSGVGVSSIGDLTCFRDRTSVRAVAVYYHGRLAGDLTDLVGKTAAWQAAADMPEFQTKAAVDRRYPEGAADLEYTYLRGDIKMHGMNRMLRLSGQVYTIYFLTTDIAWPNDRGWLNLIQPSFLLAD